MAVLAKARLSSGLVGWVVLACALGFLASCSGTAQAPPVESAPQAESTTQDPPRTRIFTIESEVTWSVGVGRPPAAPDDRLLYLAPTTPADGFETEARLRRAEVGDSPEYTVRVEWPAGGLSVHALPAIECPATRGGMLWKLVRIRGVQGCESTNEAGLYFARWVEGETRFKYSSFDITGARARKMLEDWDPLE
jgi:hypothetical protein